MQRYSEKGNVNEAAALARKIVALPKGEVPALIQKLLLERKLSRSVGALDDMIRQQPEHKVLGVKALQQMNLWWQSERDP